MSCHATPGASAEVGARKVALVGSPNSGKTTLFNALTGLRAKVGNYPGVTVAKYQGSAQIDGHTVEIEDLPGTYSLDPISPDEQVVVTALEAPVGERPDAVIVTLDATTIRRSLGLLAHALAAELPTMVVVTFADELARRGGSVDVDALSRELGLPVVALHHADRRGLDAVRALLADPSQWQQPVVLPPTSPAQITGWSTSVLTAASFTDAQLDARTSRIDRWLLHPVWGSLIFFATMFAFFQVIFTVAAPIQDFVEQSMGSLGEAAARHIEPAWLASFVAEALIGGVGAVVVFLPQIALLFAMITFLEGVGYMSRAAFLMDKVMATAGLEGRAFVALLSSLACAIPGIMATRTLPSAKDRIATMMAAPLMTCSARLPVYLLLIGMLVPPTYYGPVSLRGIIMFALYLGGAVAAMTTAWIFQRFTGRKNAVLPFYMEMPPYRWPKVRSILLSVWESCKGFLIEVGTIILCVTVILWGLMNLPLRSEAEMTKAGVDTSSTTQVRSYVLDHSVAATLGKAVEPVFAPLGFDWRINVGVLASLSAREVFVATMGQVAAAEDPENPVDALENLTVREGPRTGEKLFTAPVVAALLVFFMFALQCMSTIGVMRRETGTWKWPAIAFGYMFALAWLGAWVAHGLVGLVI